MQRCLKYMSSGHVFFASADKHVCRHSKKQIRRHVSRLTKLRCEVLTSSSFMFKKDNGRGRHCRTSDPPKIHDRAQNALKKAKKHGYESIHERWVHDERFRNSQKEIGWTKEFCLELDKLENTDRSYHSTREERERSNSVWVFHETDDSVGRNTTETSAHTDYSKVRKEFRRTKNVVATSRASHPTLIPLEHQRQQRQRPQWPQQSQRLAVVNRVA